MEMINITIEPSGTVARVTTEEMEVEPIAGVPTIRRSFGEVEGIPAPHEGTIYIVSSMVLSAVDRDDVVAPDTGSTALRNEKGHIVAVTRLVRP